MEHIVIQTEFETIKRFELAKKSIWLAKKVLNGQEVFGIGETKKGAEKNALENKQFANKGTPNFINEIGSIHKYNNRLAINSVPNVTNFIQTLIPLSWHSKYYFRAIIDQNKEQTYVEIIPTLHLDVTPLRYWSDDSKGYHQQITNCVYQFYIDLEQGITSLEQNKKLGEWQKYWYSKLTPRRM